MTDEADAGYGGGGWTGALRRRAVRALPPEKLLPDRQPAYVSSWIYVFGVLTIAALVWVLVSGAWLAVAGPAWWHSSTVGHFVNSTAPLERRAVLLLHGDPPVGASSSWPRGEAGGR